MGEAGGGEGEAADHSGVSAIFAACRSLELRSSRNVAARMAGSCNPLAEGPEPR